MRYCAGCGSPVGRWEVAEQTCLFCINGGRDGPQLLHAIGGYGIGMVDPDELGFEGDDEHLTAVEVEPLPAEFPWSVGAFPPRFPLVVLDGQLSLEAAPDD